MSRRSKRIEDIYKTSGRPLYSVEDLTPEALNSYYRGYRSGLPLRPNTPTPLVSTTSSVSTTSESDLIYRSPLTRTPTHITSTFNRSFFGNCFTLELTSSPPPPVTGSLPIFFSITTHTRPH